MKILPYDIGNSNVLILSSPQISTCKFTSNLTIFESLNLQAIYLYSVQKHWNILTSIAENLLKESQDLDPIISQIIDENYEDLILKL
jgi:hypothetical protein